MSAEILTFTFKDKEASGDPSAASLNAIKQYVSVALYGHGAQQGFYGVFVDLRDTVVIVTTWDSYERWVGCAKSSAYQVALANVESVGEGKATIYHVGLQPWPPSGVFGQDPKVGVTELAFTHFAETMSPDSHEKYMNRMMSLAPALQRSEAITYASGWAHELGINPKNPSEATQVYISAVGWANVDAHWNWQATSDFKENIHYMMEADDLRHTHLFHVKLHQLSGTD